MKIISFIPVALVVLQSNAQLTKSIPASPIFQTIKKIDVAGKINQYIPNNDNRFITFRIHDISGKLTDTSVLIKGDGIFSAKLFQPFEGDIAVMYKGVF